MLRNPDFCVPVIVCMLWVATFGRKELRFRPAVTYYGGCMCVSSDVTVLLDGIR